MGELSDEEAITLALLHGCGFKNNHDCSLWYADDSPVWHDVEKQHAVGAGRYSFETREQLARAYCEFYKLGTLRGNNP